MLRAAPVQQERSETAAAPAAVSAPELTLKRPEDFWRVASAAYLATVPDLAPVRTAALDLLGRVLDEAGVRTEKRFMDAGEAVWGLFIENYRGSVPGWQVVTAAREFLAWYDALPEGPEDATGEALADEGEDIWRTLAGLQPPAPPAPPDPRKTNAARTGPGRPRYVLPGAP